MNFFLLKNTLNVECLINFVLWQHWKSYSKDQKPKHPTIWAAGGPGMQAVFLDSGQRSCGTGVFLPRTAGSDVEKPRKPGTFMSRFTYWDSITRF